MEQRTLYFTVKFVRILAFLFSEWTLFNNIYMKKLFGNEQNIMQSANRVLYLVDPKRSLAHFSSISPDSGRN